MEQESGEKVVREYNPMGLEQIPAD